MTETITLTRADAKEILRALRTFDAGAMIKAEEILITAIEQQAEQVPEGWDNCRAENQCRRWCGNSACVSHAAPKGWA